MARSDPLCYFNQMLTAEADATSHEIMYDELSERSGKRAKETNRPSNECGKDKLTGDGSRLSVDSWTGEQFAACVGVIAFFSICSFFFNRHELYYLPALFSMQYSISGSETAALTDSIQHDDG